MKENKLFLFLLLITSAGILAFHFAYHTGGMGNMNYLGESSITKSNAVEPVPANEVRIKNYSFSPAKITIKKGTTVTWLNEDLAPHTVTVDDKSLKGPDSKLFGKGQKYTYTFSTPGIYSYHCEPHPYMKAVVEVTE